MTDKNNEENPKQLLLKTTSDTGVQAKKDTSQKNSKNPKNKSNNKRFPYYNNKKEKELFKRLTLIVGILAIAVFITLYFISPFSRVEKIVVSGVQKSDAKSIVKSSNLKTNKSLWEQYFKRSDISKDIVKENPRVKSASIELKQINTLQINVTEYKTIGYVKKDEKTYEVLSNGKIVDKVDGEEQSDLPQLINFTEGENLDEFIKSYDKIHDDIKEKIDTIESIATKTNPFRIQLNMKDGNKVIGLSTTITDKMAFYDKIAAEMDKAGTIDMEAGTTGVFSYPADTEDSKETKNSETDN